MIVKLASARNLKHFYLPTIVSETFKFSWLIDLIILPTENAMLGAGLNATFSLFCLIFQNHLIILVSLSSTISLLSLQFFFIF